MLEIFKPNSMVTCNDEPMRVIAVCIDSDGVRYQVGYWLSLKWETVWLPAEEVKPYEEVKSIRIGFK